LFRALEELSLDVTVCSNLAQAIDVISRQGFELVFCDWHLPDGSYADLIRATRSAHAAPRVVAMVRISDREIRLEALSNGAFAVVRWPGCATDVEMAILGAQREKDRLSLLPPVA
jgi:DNA-binding response OmpR family regulator